MPLSFTQANNLFKENKLNELCSDPEGLRFLKLRSLNRPEYLARLFDFADIEQPNVGARALFEAAFSANIPQQTVEECARAIFSEERTVRRAAEPDLVNQLYRVQEFNWGGLHQNSLEKTIVDNYIKKITQYEGLCAAIENELLTSLRGYVICSWYNHWTSIIIEDLFKDHPNVLPAVGLVKMIDFFVKDVPFDLKVTYLPEGYVADCRKAALKAAKARDDVKGAGDMRPETTLLKQAARKHNLPIDKDLPAAALLQDLWAKVADHPSQECMDLISGLKVYRDSLIADMENDPSDILEWLYVNQGDRRFDASYRLFVILADQRNYFDSWKLKRAKALMESRICAHLDNCGDTPGRQVEFIWPGDGKTYKTTADLLVIRQA